MKIAILSYHFTPSTMVAALRARGLAKYLGRAGHEVTVVTAQPDPETSSVYDVVTLPGRTPSSRMREAMGLSPHHTIVDALSDGEAGSARAAVLRALRRGAQEIVFWPDEAAEWAGRVRGWVTARSRSGALDAVISTSPPVSTHLAALRADRRGVAWVADYRDLWTAAHHYPLSAARRAFDRRWDARIAREADAVTVATEGFARTVRSAFPGTPVAVVYNGYDPGMFANTSRATPNGRLTLVHAGSLYGGRVDPSVLLDAIVQVTSSGRIPRDRIRLEFFSAAEAWLTRKIADRALGDVVVVHGTRPRELVIEAYRTADVLVLMQWDDPGELAVMPAKTFEYLGARRSLLCVGCGAGGEVDRLVASSGAGVVVRDVGAAARALGALYDEFSVTGFVSDPTDELIRLEFTQMAMAGSMEEALDRAAGAARSRGR